MSALKKIDYLPGFILTGLIVLLIILGFVPSQASADPKTYGPWMSGDKNSAENWQANVTPWNTDRSETINSGCIVDDKPLSGYEKGMMVNILSAAGAVYNGNFGEGVLSVNKSTSQIEIDDREKLKEAEEAENIPKSDYFEVNGGFPKGPEGYRLFLAQEKKLLRAGKWIPFNKRKVVGDGQKDFGPDDYQVPTGTWVANTVGKDGQLETGEGGGIGGLVKGFGAAGLMYAGGMLIPGVGQILTIAAAGTAAFTLYGALFGGDDKIDPVKDQQRLATLLPKADNPLETAFKLPFGCSLPIPSAQKPSVGDMVEEPVGFIIASLIGVIDSVIDLPYSLVENTAWQWSFMTPHSERGDLLWQLPTNCVAEDGDKGEAATIPNACKGAKNLGFSTESLSVKKQTAPFLSMSHFAQWLISGFYFIIFFTAIVFFIMKGTRSRVLNVLTIIPRVLLSIVLTIFATFIIGAIISFANFLVTAIFSLGSAWDVGAANVMLAQPDLVMGGIPEPGGSILRLIVKILITYFYILFVITALVRQFALVILIVLAPVAIFCIINPSWQQYFNKWFRTLLAVAFIPVILAFLLKLGLITNPAINNPDATYGSVTLGLFSLVMLLAVFWAMSRVLRASRNFILGQSSLATGAMAGAGDRLSRWGANHNNLIGRAARRAGGNLSLASENSQALGSMVPPDKVLGGALGGLSAAGGGGAIGAARAGLGGNIIPAHSRTADHLRAYQSRRAEEFQTNNSLVSTDDFDSFRRVNRSIDDQVSALVNDINDPFNPIEPRQIPARRDAIISSVMGSGGLPLIRNGRFYLETNEGQVRNYITRYINSQPAGVNQFSTDYRPWEADDGITRRFG